MSPAPEDRHAHRVVFSHQPRTREPDSSPKEDPS